MCVCVCVCVRVCSIVVLCCVSLQEIEGLETLTSLTELWLGKNKITKLANLTSLVKLERLDVQVRMSSLLFILSDVLSTVARPVSRASVAFLSMTPEQSTGGNRRLGDANVTVGAVPFSQRHLRHSKPAFQRAVDSAGPVREPPHSRRRPVVLYAAGGFMGTETGACSHRWWRGQCTLSAVVVVDVLIDIVVVVVSAVGVQPDSIFRRRDGTDGAATLVHAVLGAQPHCPRL